MFCVYCVQGSEELFSTEPLPARMPAVESATHVGSGTAEAGSAASFMTRPRTPISPSLHVDNVRHIGVERLDDDLVGGEPEVSELCRISHHIYLVFNSWCSLGCSIILKAFNKLVDNF